MFLTRFANFPPELVLFPIIDQTYHRLELRSNHPAFLRGAKLLFRKSWSRREAHAAQRQVEQIGYQTVLALHQVYAQLAEQLRVLSLGTSPYSFSDSIGAEEAAERMLELGRIIRPFMPDLSDRTGEQFFSE
jgi:hypothetical protein